MATRDHTVDGAEITPAPRTLTGRVGLSEDGLSPIAESHNGVDLGYNSMLLGEGWKWN